MTVADWLARRGVEAVHNLEGGIDAWSERVDPSVPRYRGSLPRGLASPAFISGSDEDTFVVDIPLEEHDDRA